MKNVKKLRAEKKTGNFISAHIRILLDSNLSDGSKILLIAILNDSDDFNISETVYCNKLKITKKTFHNRIKNLEENGYLRRTKIDGKVAPINGKGGKKTNSSKIMYFYVVSEYGNLNTKESEQSEQIIVEDVIKPPTPTPTPIIKNTKTNQLTEKQKFFWDNNSEKIKSFFNSVCQQKKVEKIENVKKEFINLINEKIEYIYSTSRNNKNVITKRIQEELLSQKPLFILIEKANKKINKKELV